MIVKPILASAGYAAVQLGCFVVAEAGTAGGEAASPSASVVNLLLTSPPTAILSWLVYYLVKVYLPKLHQEHREERQQDRQADREERGKDRELFRCRHDQPST